MRRKVIETFPAIISLCLTTVFFSGALCFGHSPWEDMSQVSEEEFVQWVKERAIHLSTVDWKHINLSMLSPLDKEIEGKRVVYLGEPDHFIHEKFDFQLNLIRYLFEQGFCYVGLEMGIFGGRLIDAYLETGDSSCLDLSRLFGDKRYVREDRDDTPRGFPALKNPDYRKSQLSEVKWFLEQLRKLNETLKPGDERLHWFGFDADIISGIGYQDIRKRLKSHSSQKVIREILKRMDLVKGESVLEEAARIGDLIRYVDNSGDPVTSIIGKREYTLLTRDLRSLRDGLIFLDAFKKAPSPEWGPALREREKTIFRQMDEFLEDLDKDDKIILIGHNMHLSKDYTKVWMSWGPMWPSIGSHMVHRLPGQIYSIWMLYDHGRHGNMWNESFYEDVPSHPLRIERLFTKAGLRFILPFHSQDQREQYLDEDRNFVANGGLAHGFIRSQADAIFFVSEVTPIRER
ncbi:MAG: erythromycin esterase family protein [Candidatus Aminicenantes bacterium]